jgi:type VI secretion system protein ImpJ
MYNLPVHWSEGLFLQPHHFQAADRYWTEVFQTSEQWDNPYYYGIRQLEFSHEALGNFQFQVNVCRLRMKDGTLVALGAGQEPDRVDLKEAFAKESVIRVFLAVPKLKMGRVNVAARAEADQQRFVETRQLVQDEGLGGNEQEIRFRDLNVRLMLSTQDTAGYELLPIAQVQRAGEKEATPQLDTSYIPPVLAIEAWPPLGRDIVRAIYDIIGRKIEILSEQILSRGITLVSQEPGDMDRLLMLHVLNAAYAYLHVLTFAIGVHPFLAYSELCRLVGHLSIFGRGRRPPEIPVYDHDDLARIFNYIKQQIQLLLDSLPDYEYEQRWFEGDANGMRVAIESRWLSPDWQWLVGVHRGSLSERDCLNILSVGVLNWVLGSADKVEFMFRARAPGLVLEPVRQTPRALPPSNEWSYFTVGRASEAWKDVMRTQTLAMRFSTTHIANRDTLQGSRKLILNLERGKQVILEFALFAVPLKQRNQS